MIRSLKDAIQGHKIAIVEDIQVAEGSPMDMPGVVEARALLHTLQFIDPTWEGRAFVPFWGSELDISIDPDEEGIILRQLDILHAILNHPHDLRDGFEQALFDYYQAEIDGLYCEYGADAQPIPGSGPPKLTEPLQVWGLIDEPVVCIPMYFRTSLAIEFELSFNCEWDPEHGLGVLYRDWKLVKFGSWDL